MNRGVNRPCDNGQIPAWGVRVLYSLHAFLLVSLGKQRYTLACKAAVCIPHGRSRASSHSSRCSFFFAFDSELGPSARQTPARQTRAPGMYHNSLPTFHESTLLVRTREREWSRTRWRSMCEARLVAQVGYDVSAGTPLSNLEYPEFVLYTWKLGSEKRSSVASLAAHFDIRSKASVLRTTSCGVSKSIRKPSVYG